MSTTPIVHSVSIFNRDFWKGAAERALKTFAQALVGVPLFLTAASGTSAADLPGEVLQTSTWVSALTGAAIMAVLSILTSIANPTFVAGENVLNHPQAELPEAVVVDPYGSAAPSATPAAATPESGSSAVSAAGPEDPEAGPEPVVRAVTVSVDPQD